MYHLFFGFHSHFSSVTQLCPTLCDPMNHSTPGHPVHHQLPESTQTHVHWVSDAIQPSHLGHVRALSSFLCCTVSSHWLSILHIVVCICQPPSPNSFSPPLSPLGVHTFVLYVCVSISALPNDAFELWHWRRLLTVPWTARRSSQSVLKEISSEYSLEGLMLKLTQWTWGWASSRSWWWTGKPGVLQSMGAQRIGHDWATELNWIISFIIFF